MTLERNYSSYWLVPLGIVLLLSVSCEREPPPTDPLFVTASAADFISDDDLVVGIAWNGVVKAYPIAALAPVEVVNDRLGDMPVAVTWCPITGSALIFKRSFGEQAGTFDFHPDLYKMNLLFTDLDTESIWSQLAGEALEGEMRGSRLEPLPVMQTSWGHWLELHPQTTVMTPEFGWIDFSYFERKQDPIDGVAKYEVVLGVTIDGMAKAYPFPVLQAAGGSINDILGGRTVRVDFDPGSPSAAAYQEDGALLAAVTVYWFAWRDFHPSTEVWR